MNGYLLFAVSILLALCGCSDLTSSKNQLANKGRVNDTVSAMTTDTKADKVVMTSAQPETLGMVPDGPASALDVANVRKVRLLVHQKTFETDEATGALKLKFADLELLKIFSAEPIPEDFPSCLPEWITSLEGQLVRIVGRIAAHPDEVRMTQFVLFEGKMYGNPFGRSSSDYMLIKLIPGTTIDYVSWEKWIEVVGRFMIKMESADGSVIGLYVIEDAKVIVR